MSFGGFGGKRTGSNELYMGSGQDSNQLSGALTNPRAELQRVYYLYRCYFFIHMELLCSASGTYQESTKTNIYFYALLSQ